MSSLRVWAAIAAFGGFSLLHAQTSIDLRTQTKSVDFSSALSTKPSKAGVALPATCSVGETFFNTAALAGHNLSGCTAINTWTLLGSNLWFGGGAVNAGDCAAFDTSGNIVSAGGTCTPANAVTMASPFTAAGSLLLSAGPGRQGVASLCTETGGTLACPGGFTGRTTWLGGSGTNSRQILGPAGSFSSNFNYRWTDTIPTAATLMKVGAPASGESSLGPAVPEADYVTPSGAGNLQNKMFDGTSVFNSYLPWLQISKPAAPGAGYLRVYAKTGAGVCWVNSTGTETCAGAVSSAFGRAGAVTAQAGDYTYAQISNTPAALPPNGPAAGDLSGTYPSPTVMQVNGAAIPSGGVVKANSDRQLVAAVAGTDYAPAAPGTSILKANGSGGFAGASSSDIVNLFSACTGTQYLGADGACHAASGSVVLATGAGAPYSSCAAPSGTNLAVYVDTTNGDEWWCYATNSWKKMLSVTGSGPYLVSGATGGAPSTPATGMVSCYFDGITTQTCLDPAGNAWQMVKATTLSAMRLRSCDLVFGNSKSGTAPLSDADLGPQSGVCFVPAAATVLEVDVRANGGTPRIVMGIDDAGTVNNLLSSSLATAANGGRACASATAVAGIDGTTCSPTLQNTNITAGDYIQAVSGSAGGTATWMTVHVVYSIN